MTRGLSLRALTALWVGCVALSVAASAMSAVVGGRPPEAFLSLAINGIVLATSGYVIARRQLTNRIGYLLILSGAATVTFVVLRYLIPMLAVTSSIFQGISVLALTWVLLGFPTGELAGRAERAAVGAAAIFTAFAAVADLISYEPLVHDAPCHPCAPNPFRILELDAYPALSVITSIGVTVAALFVAALAIRRWWRAEGAERRVLAPVLFGGVVVGLGYAVAWGALATGSAIPYGAQILLLLRILVPIGLAVTFIRVYAARGAVSGAVVQLGASPRLETLEGALRRAVHDPKLIVARWSPTAGAYLDREGLRVAVDDVSRDRAVMRLERDEQPMAAVVYDASLAVDSTLVASVADAVRFAVDTVDMRDQLHARGGDVGNLPRGEVAFLFGDLEGSTELLSRLGDAYVDVLTELRGLVRDAVERHDGRVVDLRADECFLAFARPADALAAALELQARLSSAGWPAGERPKMRIGLHLGQPELTSDGYVGLDVHRAARVMAIAHGGEIVASAPFATAVGGGQPVEVSLVPLGYQTLKGIPEPEFLYRIALAPA